MTKYLTFLITLLVSSTLFSQNKSKVNIFLNENIQQVESSLYFRKCNTFLYHCSKKENDSLILNTMYPNYKFGKLDASTNSQIKILLSRTTQHKDFNNKTLIITYTDSLLGYEQLKETPPREININGKNTTLTYDLEVYNEQRELFDKTQKKCIKRTEKLDVLPLYFFKTNVDYTRTNENFKWHKIPRALNSVFFKNESGLLILKPDGNYFIYRQLPEEFVFDMLKKDWTGYTTDYKLAESNLLNMPNGFFKDIYDDNTASKDLLVSDRLQQDKGRFRENQLSYNHLNLKKLREYIYNMSTKCFTYGNY
ncbi:hypothetical protein [Lacinutrix undariae]